MEHPAGYDVPGKNDGTYSESDGVDTKSDAFHNAKLMNLMPNMMDFILKTMNSDDLLGHASCGHMESIGKRSCTQAILATM